MADSIATPAVEHDPPSLPSSPPAKRTKNIEPAPTTLSVASMLNDTAPTPTPHSPPQATAPMDPTAAAATSLPILPSMGATGYLPSAPEPLRVKLCTEKAQQPTKGSVYAAGYDLYAAEEATIPARGRAWWIRALRSNVRLALTDGRVAPRSGLAAKKSIDVGAGVIDADYRGLVKVILFNFGDENFQVQVGDRIAQLILEKYHMCDVAVVQELDDSVRGAGGFGSTGGFGGALPPLMQVPVPAAAPGADVTALNGAPQ
ncbi:Deoxyuridine 5'-triphosphate nucleotidohydrolase [Taxawa tesnikishii (nom. ined.)]|nr:Deoxyuridine 5'-triphosphate nucleotidohydrolase [Dothideales sp. JES 119]